MNAFRKFAAVVTHPVFALSAVLLDLCEIIPSLAAVIYLSASIVLSTICLHINLKTRAA